MPSVEVMFAALVAIDLLVPEILGPVRRPRGPASGSVLVPAKAERAGRFGVCAISRPSFMMVTAWATHAMNNC